MLLLSEEDMRAVYSMSDAIEADKEAFRLAAEGKGAVPLRTQIPAPEQDGCFLFMPSYLPSLETAAVKIVNIFPHNAEQGLPTAPAQVLLIDGRTGITEAIMDGTYLTQLRTGAATGAAFSLLARADCAVGALIGTGGQAAAQLEGMLAACPGLQEVRVFSRSWERTQAFAASMEKDLAAKAVIRPVRSSDNAVRDADLIVTVTSATTPVFDGHLVKAGATISAIGSYQPHMQELDSVVLQRAHKIYFDSTDAVLAEAGDVRIPLEQGLIQHSDFTGDIGQVIAGTLPGRENDEEIILFKSVGMALQDLVTARRIYDRAAAQGMGISWP
ncbi:ornithine cyclodeaminase family protein [uncultured Megasphaera sp.]|uniref:ornithine cyclodeaminase family protein n=1 Tax=uncultured Megasphaera sp. TaxID=165188 RepID=UPI0026594B4A|nr:ornithine cyclodeaminase family protein [uncultured Megasphaera sp.]